MIETAIRPQPIGHGLSSQHACNGWNDRLGQRDGSSDGLELAGGANDEKHLTREHVGPENLAGTRDPASLGPLDLRDDSLKPSPRATETTFDTETADRSNGEGNGEILSGRRGSQQKAAVRPSSMTSVKNGSEVAEEGIAHDEIEEATKGPQRRRGSSLKSSRLQDMEKDKVLKLSPAKIHELTSSPKSLPMRAVSTELQDIEDHIRYETAEDVNTASSTDCPDHKGSNGVLSGGINSSTRPPAKSVTLQEAPLLLGEDRNALGSSATLRPVLSDRAASTPSMVRRSKSPSRTEGPPNRRQSQSRTNRNIPAPLQLDDRRSGIHPPMILDPAPSPMPPTIPLPPLSIPTYLQLELSSARPSPLYIHRSITSDFPYESSRVKIERLQNFFLLPPQLEQILWFGSLACFDAWLYTFTILPLRFLKALYILGQSWMTNLGHEMHFVSRFIVKGIGRMWRRRRRQNSSVSSQVDKRTEPSMRSRNASNSTPSSDPSNVTVSESNEKQPEAEKHEPARKLPRLSTRNHRRTKSTPSALLPDDKADILKGLLIIFTCTILMSLDASRMYHWVRGQAAIKLYVIYNVLEVCDRLFSAIGQDVLECLFSREALERKPDGRSKVLRPFWLFLLALVYTVIHSAALFYQVITLNVAVNSYSNALITLLMSNQFVEIKSTVFKKFEKENLFQLTCADVVERFQLWLMLTIIASRNIVETGGLNFSSASSSSSPNLPPRSTSILPKSFTIFPEWTGQVLAPFFLVLGSEMIVDWLKHSYITKFNNTKPAIYGRFLDILAKDYYSSAFADQNLTRRLGLPIIPLSCLFIRAAVQTYHMFLATHMPLPMPSSATSLAVENASFHSNTPTSTAAALARLDALFRRALGRSSFPGTPAPPFSMWNPDDFTALLTRILLFLLIFLLLLTLKLCVGIALLAFSRHRYKSMKERENEPVHAEGRRVGGWGVVEVDEDKRRWIYGDDVGGLGELRLREKELKEKERRTGGEGGLEERLQGVKRWGMVGKRIW